jgi:histidinol-phosphate aminotransferase
MADIKRLARENVLKLTPYSSARDEFHGTTGIFMDANENPYGSLNRYPDPYQKKLKTAISELKNMPVENIFLGNGSDEIIDLCFRTFCNPGTDKTMIFPPTYGMYEVSASVNDVKVLRVPLDTNFQIDIRSVKEHTPDPHLKLVFICSPNNPTGNAMDPGAVEWIIKNTGSMVVIDEAYADFSTKPSFISLTLKYNNLIVMQTFSKALGMAAGRVGMAFADPETVRLFNKIKPPYNISSINQKAALTRLESIKSYKAQSERIKGERRRLAGILEKFSFVEKVYPSDANFLLVKVRDANKLYNYLIQRNIVVRNRHGVIENCIRITAGKKNENNELIKAFKKFS